MDPVAKVKSFWERPEGFAGMLFGLGAVCLGGYALFKALPSIIVMMQNLYMAIGLGVGLIVLLTILLDKRNWILAGAMYQSLMRKITSIFITIDPIGIIDNYIRKLKNNIETLDKQLASLLGQKEKVNMVITTAKKKMVESLKIARQADKQGKKNETGPVSPLSYEENENKLIINTAGVSIVLDKISGLFSIMKDSDTLVHHSPCLMILPLTENNGKQLKGRYTEPESYTETAGGWMPGTVDIESTKKNACIIRVSGRYNEATGSYSYEIGKDGVISVSYDFRLDAEVSPRQVGLVFDVNDSLSTLSWERTGFWSYYPPVHIGRVSGEAKTNMEVPVSWQPGPVIPPQNIWEWDRNDLGSNDFRSTRTRILRAGLQSADGKAIEVLSDGTQGVRAWHSDGMIRLLITDYNDGGYERLNYASEEQEKTVWQKGKQISGTVRIRLKHP